MMRIAIDFNGITKSLITVANVTKTGLSNDRLNQYNVFINGIDTGIIVDHWREDGYIELCYRVMKRLHKNKPQIIEDWLKHVEAVQ